MRLPLRLELLPLVLAVACSGGGTPSEGRVEGHEASLAAWEAWRAELPPVGPCRLQWRMRTQVTPVGDPSPLGVVTLTGETLHQGAAGGALRVDGQVEVAAREASRGPEVTPVAFGALFREERLYFWAKSRRGWSGVSLSRRLVQDALDRALDTLAEIGEWEEDVVDGLRCPIHDYLHPRYLWGLPLEGLLVESFERRRGKVLIVVGLDVDAAEERARSAGDSVGPVGVEEFLEIMRGARIELEFDAETGDPKVVRMYIRIPIQQFMADPLDAELDLRWTAVEMTHAPEVREADYAFPADVEFLDGDPMIPAFEAMFRAGMDQAAGAAQDDEDL